MTSNTIMHPIGKDCFALPQGSYCGCKHEHIFELKSGPWYEVLDLSRILIRIDDNFTNGVNENISELLDSIEAKNLFDYTKRFPAEGIYISITCCCAFNRHLQRIKTNHSSTAMWVIEMRYHLYTSLIGNGPYLLLNREKFEGVTPWIHHANISADSLSHTASQLHVIYSNWIPQFDVYRCTRWYNVKLLQEIIWQIRRDIDENRSGGTYDVEKYYNAIASCEVTGLVSKTKRFPSDGLYTTEFDDYEFAIRFCVVKYALQTSNGSRVSLLSGIEPLEEFYRLNPTVHLYRQKVFNLVDTLEFENYLQLVVKK